LVLLIFLGKLFILYVSKYKHHLKCWSDIKP